MNIFEKNVKYSNKEIKRTLQQVYNELGLDKTAKATDACELFEYVKVKIHGERYMKFI